MIRASSITAPLEHAHLEAPPPPAPANRPDHRKQLLSESGIAGLSLGDYVSTGYPATGKPRPTLNQI